MQVKTQTKTIEDFYPLSDAEEYFVEKCCAGEPTILADEQDRSIRGELVRYFLLGGCEQNRPTEAGVLIANAVITGKLDFSSCRTHLSLLLMRCKLEQSPDFSAAHLSRLSLEGSIVPGMFADNITIEGSLFLRNGFKATGEVSLSSANIGDQLECSNGIFENENGKALYAQGVEVNGGVFLDEDFTTKGEVSLSGAKIEGQLTCSNSTFKNENGIALNAQNIHVKDGVFLDETFTATGEVSLSGAKIGGQLTCSNSTFKNERGKALIAHNVDVKGSVFLDEAFTSKGEVSLSSAKIAGQLACSNGTFENERGKALYAQDVEVNGGVFLNETFNAKGEVSLSSAKIGGQLACNNGTFENEKGTALIAQNINVKGSFFLEGFTCTSGTIDFQFAKIGAIAGGFENWPEARFFINGLTYETIFARDINADTMLNWLSGHKTNEFKPQPYEQMAKVLKTLGHRRDASLVLEAMEKQLRPEIRNRMRVKKLDGTWSMAFTSLWLDIKRPMTYILDMFQGVIVGYGYRPSRAFISSVFIIMFATCVAFQTWHAGDMVPNSPILLVEGEWKEFASDRNANAAKEWTEKADAGRDYETFNPFVYALDVFVPIIDFGQERAWAPSTERGWWGRQLYWMRWLFKVFGWIITALGAAAVTGIIRQDR